MSVLQHLANWYRAQCDGEWEHAFGIKLDTLDNPGWSIRINLQDTRLHHKPFVPVSIDNESDDDDWLSCRVEDGEFHGSCGPEHLERMIHVFLDWAE